MLEFKIIKQCNYDVPLDFGDDADFLLEENDYMVESYSFYYHLIATKRQTGSSNKFLGFIEIIKVGQKKGEKNLLRKIYGDSVFNELPVGFVSICLEQSFIDWLSFQDVALRKELVDRLHIVTGKSSHFYDSVKNDKCFIDAVMRFSTMDNNGFHKLEQLIHQVDRRYHLRNKVIKLKYDNCDDDVSLSFTCLPSIESNDLPNGIVAFIGANGSGKSTALYNLAKAMYLFPETRAKLERQFCRIIPNDIVVERLILISYSPFDNFAFPSTYNFALHDDDTNPTRGRDSRFIYCGIRDLDVEHQSFQDNGLHKDLKYIQKDRQTITNIKSQERLAADFAMAFHKLKIEDKRNFYIWPAITDKAKAHHPDLAAKMLRMATLITTADMKREFLGLSTGYKFLFHSLAYLISYITEGSLILFDEPENHIHPPLLSFMMAQYREILAHFDSVMLLSTHSPVIVQELFADNVLKVYKDGVKIRIQKPQIETFGATFGEINSEVFDLTSDVSPFFKAMDTLYDFWDLKNKQSLEAMFDALQEHLKRPVSNQMASYLISKYYSDNPDKE